MKLPNLSLLESESLMRNQMKAVKGGDGDSPSREGLCLSCFCPHGDDEFLLYLDTNWAALLYVPAPEPD